LIEATIGEPSANALLVDNKKIKTIKFLMIISKLDKVNLKINNQNIVKDISLTLLKNKITTLIGPNGGGKSSIAKIILGIIKPNNGKIFIKDKIKIGYMPQKVEIDKTIPISAIDFIKLYKGNNFLDGKIDQLSSRLGIKNILKNQIHNLSGGQFQKIVFLRSIINNPDLLVLDEPTQFMDINAIDEFYQIINEVRKDCSCSILLISHDLNMVMQKTDEVFCINKHICCSGTPQSINKHPEYISLFGKKSEIGIYHHHHDHNHDISNI